MYGQELCCASRQIPTVGEGRAKLRHNSLERHIRRTARYSCDVRKRTLQLGSSPSGIWFQSPPGRPDTTGLSNSAKPRPRGPWGTNVTGWRVYLVILLLASSVLWSRYRFPCYDVLNVPFDEITSLRFRISRYVCVAELLSFCQCYIVLPAIDCSRSAIASVRLVNPSSVVFIHPYSARLIHLSDSFQANIRAYSVRGLSFLVASCLFSSDFFVHRGQNVSRKSTPETFWQHRGLIRSRWKMIFPCFRYQQIGYIL